MSRRARGEDGPSASTPLGTVRSPCHSPQEMLLLRSLFDSLEDRDDWREE